MPTEFKLPELGENIESGDLVRLMIKPGASITAGQPVMELETDKAVIEVPSSIGGVVREIKVKEGQKVKVGEVIFTLEGGVVAEAEPARRHEPVEHISGQQAARLAFQLAMRAEGKTEEQALPPDKPQTATPAFSMPVQLGKVAGTDRDPIPAAPHVRRLAREIGVNIRSVPGSGPGGRISEDDVKLCAKNALIAAAAAAQTPRGSFVEPELPDFAKWGKTERVSMRGVRRKNRRASSSGVEYNPACHTAGSRRHHRTRTFARPLRAASGRSWRQDDGDGDRAESLRLGAESLSPVQCLD
jgi:pyruvate dehydrogenase E2 component (dihydrolipoamide acetyltransferase)